MYNPKSMFSPEQNYFFLFAMRYPVQIEVHRGRKLKLIKKLIMVVLEVCLGLTLMISVHVLNKTRPHQKPNSTPGIRSCGPIRNLTPPGMRACSPIRNQTPPGIRACGPIRNLTPPGMRACSPIRNQTPPGIRTCGLIGNQTPPGIRA